MDFPGHSLPGVMVTAVTEAWEVTAATERTREADRGSSLTPPPFCSCRKGRDVVRSLDGKDESRDERMDKGGRTERQM